MVTIDNELMARVWDALGSSCGAIQAAAQLLSHSGVNPEQLAVTALAIARELRGALERCEHECEAAEKQQGILLDELESRLGPGSGTTERNQHERRPLPQAQRRSC